MQLYIVFEKNTTTGAYFIVGVADNQHAADNIAKTSLAKGINYNAYTSVYKHTGALNRDCWVVYAKNNWLDPTTREKDSGRKVFGKMYYTGDSPQSVDIRIYKGEDSAKKAAEELLSDLGAESYEHFDQLETYCVNVRINDVVDY